MKKTIASASLAALSVAGVYDATAQGLTNVDQSKPWSVGILVRGFYDSNFTTSPSTTREASWGFGVTPDIGLTVAMDQTYIGLNFLYDARWYEAPDQNNWRQSARLAFDLKHAFNERYAMKLWDKLVLTQEPAIGFGVVTAPTILSTDSSYVNNNAGIVLDGAISEQWSARVGYENRMWNYDQTGTNSRSALLDRMDQKIPVELLYHVNPTTAGLIGYAYETVGMTSDDLVSVYNSSTGTFQLVDSNYRNRNTHFLYVGAEYEVISTVDVGIRAGAQMAKYPDLDQYFPDADDDSILPYADARGTWTYNPGSTAEVGVMYVQNSTDVAQALNQNSLVAYAAINHKITPKLMGTLLGQYQWSQFQEGLYDGYADKLGMVGVVLTYELNNYLDLEFGYNYDRLSSQLDDQFGFLRSYTRNRGFLGVKASY